MALKLIHLALLIQMTSNFSQYLFIFPQARFQLFGDSVNTAARMESNGQPGKIQASGATADLLIKAGKGSWVREREDKIEAKGTLPTIQTSSLLLRRPSSVHPPLTIIDSAVTGKGVMTTYWIVVKGEGSVMSHALTASSTQSGGIDASQRSADTSARSASDRRPESPKQEMGSVEV